MSRLLVLLLIFVLIVGELDATVRHRRRKPVKKHKPHPATTTTTVKSITTDHPTASSLFRLPLNKQKVEIKIGNPSDNLELFINTDTPYSNININGCLAPNILGSQCRSKSYDPTKSKSGKFDTNNLYDYTDDFRFENTSHSIKQFEFSTSVCKDICTWCMPCNDGSIGLGPQSLETPKSFVSQAIKAGLFSKPQYTVRFDAGDKEKPFTGQGEVVFGGVDTKNCAEPGQSISVLHTESNHITNAPTDWTFRLSNYSFSYSGKDQYNNNVNEVIKPDSPGRMKYTEAQISAYQSLITLPYDIFNNLCVPTQTCLDTYFAIPCDNKLEFSFQLKDEKSGKTIDWTLNEKDLFVEKVQRSYETVKCRMAIKGETQWSDNHYKVTIGKSLYQNACVLHDLEKQSVSLSRRLN